MAAQIKVTNVFLYDEGLYRADAVVAHEDGEVSLVVRVKAGSIAQAEQAALARVHAVARAIASA